MMRRISVVKPFFDEEYGGSVVETSIGLGAVLIVLLGIMECCRAMYIDLYVVYAAHTAARYAMVRGSSWSGNSCSTTGTSSCTATGANITRFVQSISPLGVNTVSNLTVTSAWPGTTAPGTPCTSTNGNNSPGCIVQIQVTYDFNYVMPFMPANRLVLTSSSAVTIAQ